MAFVCFRANPRIIWYFTYAQLTHTHVRHTYRGKGQNKNAHTLDGGKSDIDSVIYKTYNIFQHP